MIVFCQLNLRKEVYICSECYLRTKKENRGTKKHKIIKKKTDSPNKKVSWIRRIRITNSSIRKFELKKKNDLRVIHKKTNIRIKSPYLNTLNLISSKLQIVLQKCISHVKSNYNRSILKYATIEIQHKVHF